MTEYKRYSRRMKILLKIAEQAREAGVFEDSKRDGGRQSFDRCVVSLFDYVAELKTELNRNQVKL